MYIYTLYLYTALYFKRITINIASLFPGWYVASTKSILFCQMTLEDLPNFKDSKAIHIYIYLQCKKSILGYGAPLTSMNPWTERIVSRHRNNMHFAPLDSDRFRRLASASWTVEWTNTGDSGRGCWWILLKFSLCLLWWFEACQSCMVMFNDFFPKIWTDYHQICACVYFRM